MEIMINYQGQDFLDRWKLLDQRFIVVKLKSLPRTLYDRVDTMTWNMCVTDGHEYVPFVVLLSSLYYQICNKTSMADAPSGTSYLSGAPEFFTVLFVGFVLLDPRTNFLCSALWIIVFFPVFF